MIHNVMLKTRLKDEDEFGDPEAAPFIDLKQLPRVGDQFLTQRGRAFSVILVEWRYDLGVVHLFCIEYPEQQPPEDDNPNG